MPLPKEILNNKLRKQWTNAKTEAEKKAKQLKQSKGFKEFRKKMKKLDLGPSLDKWPTLYPKWEAMSKLEEKIDDAIAAYRKSLREALEDIEDEELDLDADVVHIMLDELDAIDVKFNKFVEIAEGHIKTDLKAAKELSKKHAKLGKKVIPIRILEHSDASKLVKAKMNERDLEIIEPTKLEISIILADEAVLVKMKETELLRAKIAEEADMDQVLEDIAAAFSQGAADLRKHPENEAKIKSRIEIDVNTAVKMAAKRAAIEVMRETKVRTKYSSYKIKNAVDIAIMVGASVAAVAVMATSPLTLGASAVVGTLVLARSGAKLGDKMAQISMTANEAIEELQEILGKLNDAYLDAKKGIVGGKELGKTALKSLLPLPLINTIERCSSLCTYVERKIDGLEVKAGDISRKVGKMLNKLDGTDDSLVSWAEKNKESLTSEQKKIIGRIKDALEESEKNIHELTEKVASLNLSIKTNRGEHETMQKAVDKLAGKKPKWAEVGETIIKTGTAVGFIATGNVISPDPYEFLAATKAIASVTNTTIRSLDTARGLYGDVAKLMK